MGETSGTLETSLERQEETTKALEVMLRVKLYLVSWHFPKHVTIQTLI